MKLSNFLWIVVGLLFIIGGWGTVYVHPQSNDGWCFLGIGASIASISLLASLRWS